MNFSYLELFLIIFSQIVLLFFYHIFNKKSTNSSDPLKEKLELINSIFANTKHDKIVSLDEIKRIELEANEISVFSQDIYRDIKDSGQFSDEIDNIGTFYETVEENIKNNRVYNYFIKKNANFKHSVISFFASHLNSNQINFLVIPSEKYYFYNEIYLYEFDEEKTPMGYEFLPSISNEKEQKLYYLELDEKQVKRLLDIKRKLFNIYEESSKLEINQIKSKLHEMSSL